VNNQVKPFELIENDASAELASNRTAMSFDRTALASDRTLMAMVRTSVALIGFGFTIFQFFVTLQDKFSVPLPHAAPRRFGAALILLGLVLLTIGIVNHRHETGARRARRQRLVDEKLIHNPEPILLNGTMIVAILLWILGLLAALRVGLSIGPL
jgi:putative membrane protein